MNTKFITSRQQQRIEQYFIQWNKQILVGYPQIIYWLCYVTVRACWHDW